MITAPLAFIDTETTGLGPDDEIWEVAVIVRRDDGELSLVLQVEHDADLAARLPERFRADLARRFWEAGCVSRWDAAHILHDLLDGCHLVGANPAFDARMLTRLFAHADLEPSWHYHLIDLEAMTLGYLAGQCEAIATPWRSDDLAARVGVPTVDADGYALYERHTAFDNVLWCQDWWDALTARRRS